jgi:hypothetical protein
MLRSVMVVLVVALSVLTAACGETGAATTSSTPIRDSSVAAPSGAPVLSLHLASSSVAEGETLAASVTYANPSDERYRAIVGAGQVFNVRVSDPQGDVVFDSRPDRVLLGDSSLVLEPHATSSGTVKVRLTTPGDYDVVAFSVVEPRLETPPLRVVVSAR